MNKNYHCLFDGTPLTYEIMPMIWECPTNGCHFRVTEQALHSEQEYMAFMREGYLLEIYRGVHKNPDAKPGVKSD